jgi:PAS domain S-box-containing protein
MTDKGNNIFRLTEIVQPQDIISTLRQTMVFLVVMVFVTGAIFLLSGNILWLIFSRNAIIGLGVILIIFLLVKNKKTLLAAYATLILSGVLLFTIAWDGAGVTGTVYTMLVLVVIGSGLFIGRRAGYLTAVIALFAGLVLLYARRAGWLVNVERPITGLAALINTTFTFFIAAHMIRLAIDQVERALARAQNEVEERKQAEAEIRRLNIELENKVDTEQKIGTMRQRLLDFSRELLATVDVTEILEIIRHTASEMVPHDIFGPYWVDEAANVLRPIAPQGRQWFSNSIYQNWAIPLDEGIVGNAARKQQAELVNDSHIDPRAVFPQGIREKIEKEHAIFLPIRSEDEMIGMLILARRADPPYTQEEFETAQLLMSLSQLALSHARMFSQLEERITNRTDELASSNKRYQNFIDNSAEGIWLLAFDDPISLELPHEEQVDLIQRTGYVAECNQALANMYGYSSREEMIGKNLLNDLYGGEATEANIQSTLKLVREGYRSPDRLTEEVNEKGERVYFMNNAVGEISDGYLIGIWGVQRDVTTFKQIEAERERFIADLKSKNDELERFTYTVSHDLKAPLITIRGFLGYLEEDLQSADQERIKNDMDRITGATDKMQNLLDDLLELSRAGRTLDQPEAVSFEAIAQDAVNLVAGQIEAQGVHVEIGSNLPGVYGDQTRLTQVLQNLIDNAVKFMGDQPKPRIEIGHRGRDANGNSIFFVRDNGIGIESQQQKRVFELFNKISAETEGTGIGLALVKRIIESHGGKIWIKSEGLKKGATFYFTIPDSRKLISVNHES